MTRLRLVIYSKAQHSVRHRLLPSAPLAAVAIRRPRPYLVLSGSPPLVISSIPHLSHLLCNSLTPSPLPSRRTPPLTSPPSLLSSPHLSAVHLPRPLAITDYPYHPLYPLVSRVSEARFHCCGLLFSSPPLQSHSAVIPPTAAIRRSPLFHIHTPPSPHPRSATTAVDHGRTAPHGVATDTACRSRSTDLPQSIVAHDGHCRP